MTTENDPTTEKKLVIRKLANGKEVSKEELVEDINTILQVIQKYVELDRFKLKACREEEHYAARPNPRSIKSNELYVAQIERILWNVWKDGE